MNKTLKISFECQGILCPKLLYYIVTITVGVGHYFAYPLRRDNVTGHQTVVRPKPASFP